MRLAVLPGDGIGPEIATATLAVLTAVDDLLRLGLTLETYEVGLARLARDGTTLPSTVLDAARAADGIVVGPVSSAEYPPPERGGVNLSAALRTALDLFANLRPARSRPGLPSWGRTPMDLLIVRENTEGFYADRNMYRGSGEFMPTPDLALAVRKVSAEGSRRIARVAFEEARARRRKVTAVHKANVLRLSDGLFLREARAAAAASPDIAYDEQLVDSMAAWLVRDASRFDVVLTTNMFGDILSDEASELAGSLGLAASINAGDTHCMAQAQHGSAPDIAGRDLANPTSLVLSAAMLLRWLGGRYHGRGLAPAARVIEDSVDAVVSRPESRTRDLGGPLGTRAFTDALVQEIRRRLADGASAAQA